MAKTDPALIPGAATGELAHGSLRLVDAIAISISVIAPGMAMLLKSNLIIRPTHANQSNTKLTIAANITQDATPRKIIKTNVSTLVSIFNR